MTPDEVDHVLVSAHEAHLLWKEMSFLDRAACFMQMIKCLRERKKHCAELMAVEMGKPLSAGEKEIEKCIWVCEYFAEHAAEFLTPQPVRTEASQSFVTFKPLGVVFAIMPWNFPFWQVFRFAAPALMAGNAMVLKHAPNTTGCGLEVERLFQQTGFVPNLVRAVVIDTEAAACVIAHPVVQAVTLTGSPRAGRAVAARAGAALKKTVLELGGSDPYVVLEDADLDQAVKACVEARMNNGGQTCIAAKRLIVMEKVYEEFLKRVVDRMKGFVMGDPFQAGVTLGPLARDDLRRNLHRQVAESVAQGARCVLGGVIPKQKGYFYPPTVLDHVERGMPAFAEETFGPVAALVLAKDEEEALELANDSTYGLGAAVFTRDKKRGERIASQILAAGCCFVNSAVHSDPRLPFGGIKESGYGRELSAFGIREFVNVKTVSVV